MIAALSSVTNYRAWRFFRDCPVDGAIVLFGLILFGYAAHGDDQSSWGMMMAVVASLTAALASTEKLRFRALAFACVLLGLMVWVNYYASANHGFMIFWIALALTLACATEAAEQEQTLRRNAGILLGLLLGFALVQKLRADFYMDGDLLGGLLLKGEIYRNALGLILTDWPVKLVQYHGAAQTLLLRPDAGYIDIAVPGLVLWLAGAMTLGALIAQGGLEVALLFRRRLGWLFHALLLGFVALVYSTRDENIFLSMNCLLGYCLVEEDTKAARPIYALAIFYLLLASTIGLRPWIIV